MRHALLAATLLLVACQPQSPDGKAAPPPADAPAPAAAPAQSSGFNLDLSNSMTIRGNEPFWAVKLEGTTLTLSRPGQPDVAFPFSGAAIAPPTVQIEGKAADGRTLKLTLRDGQCSDGMSDQAYPMSAEAELSGGEVLRGCAIPTKDLPAKLP